MVRIGSTNLNLASWLTNWELDVTITDGAFARAMSDQYLADLSNATEIVLESGARVERRAPAAGRRRHHRGSTSRLAAGAISLGSATGAAMTGARSLAATEAKAIAHIGLALVAVALIIALLPRLVVMPLAVVLAWLGARLLARAWKLRRGRPGKPSP